MVLNISTSVCRSVSTLYSGTSSAVGGATKIMSYEAGLISACRMLILSYLESVSHFVQREHTSVDITMSCVCLFVCKKRKTS